MLREDTVTTFFHTTKRQQHRTYDSSEINFLKQTLIYVKIICNAIYTNHIKYVSFKYFRQVFIMILWIYSCTHFFFRNKICSYLFINKIIISWISKCLNIKFFLFIMALFFNLLCYIYFLNWYMFYSYLFFENLLEILIIYNINWNIKHNLIVFNIYLIKQFDFFKSIKIKKKCVDYIFNNIYEHKLFF